jgi:hypothetical protein
LTGLGLRTGLHGERRATSRLSHDKAPVSFSRLKEIRRNEVFNAGLLGLMGHFNKREVGVVGRCAWGTRTVVKTGWKNLYSEKTKETVRRRRSY